MTKTNANPLWQSIRTNTAVVVTIGAVVMAGLNTWAISQQAPINARITQVQAQVETLSATLENNKDNRDTQMEQVYDQLNQVNAKLDALILSRGNE